MNEASKNFQEPTFPGFDAPTSSPESADGTLPFDSPAGPKTGKSGPGAAHVSHSLAQGKAAASMTNAISGPSSSASSRSATLQRSLASKLAQRLESVGSMEYRQTWKEKVTPAGRSLWAHTASGLPTSDKEFTGLPPLKDLATPTAHKTTQSGDLTNQDGTPWNGASKPYQNGKPVTTALGDQVKLTGWTSARVQDMRGEDRTTFDKRIAEGRVKGGGKSLSLDSQLAGWPTTTTRDSKSKDGDSRTGSLSLAPTAHLAGWSTTSAHGNADENLEAKEARRQAAKKKWGRIFGKPLAEQVHGVITELFLVPTGRRVVLAPEFSLWLMGYPEAWARLAPNQEVWRKWQDLASQAYGKQAALELGC